MKKLLCVLAVLCLLFMQTCYAVEITFFHGWGMMEKDHVAMRKIYDDFNALHSDVTLTQVALPSSEMLLRRVSDMLAVGEAPDVIFTAGEGNTILKYMFEQGYALDLMPYIQKDKAFEKCISSEMFAQPLNKNGVFTVSDVLLVHGIWVNNHLLKEIGISALPKTWTELFRICDDVKTYAQNKQITLTPFSLSKGEATNLVAIIDYDEQKKPTDTLVSAFTRKDTLDILLQLYQYSGAHTFEYEYRDILHEFNCEESLFYFNGIWANSMIEPSLDVSFIPFPTKKGKSLACMTAMSGYVVGNQYDKEKEDACVEFVKYMLSDEIQKRILLETGQFPSNKNIDISSLTNISERIKNAVINTKTADDTMSLCVQTELEWMYPAFQNLIKENVLGHISREELEKSICELVR